MTDQVGKSPGGPREGGSATERALAAMREATRGTAFENRVYVVGGYLRDLALGVESEHEVDLVVEGDALALASLLDEAGLSAHRPVVYERFGTAMLSIAGCTVELATARSESYEAGSRKPKVRPATLREDVLRRDFTINTLVRGLHSDVVQDLTGLAHADLAARRIRTPLDAVETFRDDPLRMLRAVRFAVRFDFRIDASTWAALVQMAPRLSLLGPGRPVVSAERIRDEFVKIMEGPRPADGLRLLLDGRLLEQFAPELVETVGVRQNAWHNLDVWEHSLAALASLGGDASLSVRLAVLLHDVGKPRTRTEHAGEVRFLGHARIGAEMAFRLLRRLRLPRALCQQVSELVRLHMRLGEVNDSWSDGAVRRLLRDTGERLGQLVEVARADIAAMGPGASRIDLDAIVQRIAAVEASSRSMGMRSPLDGRQIMRVLGVRAGPVVGRAKQYLLEEVLDGRLAAGDATAAEAALRRWWSQQKQEGAS